MLLIILAGIVLAFVAFAELMFGSRVKRVKEYKYNRKNFFLTRAEHEFYDLLISAVGAEYRIFAQVHLPSLMEHTVRGQNWKGALAHINRKSVDFLLCDKMYLSPKLAIELDDRSHERQDRQDRDREVERILRECGLPLLRINNNSNLKPTDLAKMIDEMLGPKVQI